MSISLVGIMVGLPVALAMRGVMGKEKFDQWLEANSYILYTNFTSRAELIRLVEGAGYDVVEWMGSLKTHFTDQSLSYFLWEERDGKIVADMSVHDDKELIGRFVSLVEKEAGRKVFSEEKEVARETQRETERVTMPKLKKEAEAHQASAHHQAPTAVKKKPPKPKQEYRENFPSVYVDVDLLVDLLQQYGITVQVSKENRVEAEYECYKMIFSRGSAEEPFDIEIISDTDKMKALYHCLDCLNEEYFASVQEKTYLQIKEQIEEEGLEIEEEEVMEDNSIVITVSV